MRIWLTAFCALAIAALAFGAGGYAQDVTRSAASLDDEGQCPPDTLYEPYTAVCAPVNDITQLFGPADAAPGSDEVSVIRTRDASKGNRLNLDDLPVPGGYGAGTRYAPGTHQVLEHAIFHTKMFIQPGGLDSTGTDWWLMTPATNHTDSATEFVGIYASHLEEGWFGIFGRPCTEEYPCPDGDTGNGWQAGWSWPFSDFQCNFSDIVDHGGHAQKIMHYANETVRLDQDSPPLWQSSIYLWNYCAGEWDLIWRHEYRESKRDCSIEDCYKWGPILETIGTQEEINELGYEDSLLFHDGRWSLLPPEETDFVTPISPWLLLHLDANRGYGVGNRYVLAAQDIGIDIKPRSKRNKVNPLSRGHVWVALLSDGEFDPLQVDISTVSFGPDEAAANRHRVRDINKDGLADLLLRFRIRDAGIECGATEAKLTGETFGGLSLSGTDSIKTKCR